MDAPKGSLIAYATAPGKVASDGSGRNGLYTQELLKALNRPGLKVEDVFKQVRINVARASGDNQIPWEASSLTGDFLFHQPMQGPHVEQLRPTIMSERTPQQIEDELWDRIKDTDKPSVFEEYLKGYPKGRYVTQARVRLAELEGPAPTAQVPTPPRPTAIDQEAGELSFWDSIKNSNNQADYQEYLNQYPNGKYSGLARNRLGSLSQEARLNFWKGTWQFQSNYSVQCIDYNIFKNDPWGGEPQKSFPMTVGFQIQEIGPQGRVEAKAQLGANKLGPLSPGLWIGTATEHELRLTPRPSCRIAWSAPGRCPTYHIKSSGIWKAA